METVKQNHVFRRAYQKGKSIVTPYFVIYLFRNKRQPGVTRYGITTGKKIGNAVTRNRARRVLRAAFVSLESRVPSGYEVILVARGRTAQSKSTRVAEAMQKALGDWLLPLSPNEEVR